MTKLFAIGIYYKKDNKVVMCCQKVNGSALSQIKSTHSPSGYDICSAIVELQREYVSKT